MKTLVLIFVIGILCACDRYQTYAVKPDQDETASISQDKLTKFVKADGVRVTYPSLT